MFAHVTVSRPLESDRGAVAARFEADPAAWLPPPAHDVGDGRFRIGVRLGPLTPTVVATVGTPWLLPDARGRTLVWTPLTGRVPGPVRRLLPEFVGRISLRGGEEDPVALVIEGHYQPPAGAVGRAVDTVVGHRVAVATLTRLLDEVLGALQRPLAASTPRLPTPSLTGALRSPLDSSAPGAQCGCEADRAADCLGGQ